MLDGGHAPNGLPQRAGANVNCRILPAHPQEEVRQTIENVIGDPGIKVTFASSAGKSIAATAADACGARPDRRHHAGDVAWRTGSAEMTAGATDGRFLTPTGIPTYGVSGIFGDPATT